MDNQTQATNTAPAPQTQADNLPPKSTYNPLMDNVSEKPYSMQSVSVDPTQLNNYIPEPVYQPQAVGGRENPYDKIKEQSGTAAPSGGGASGGNNIQDPVNPSLKQVPQSDVKEGAKYVAKVILDFYEQIHVFVNASLPISQRKLRKLENEGAIDLSVTMADGYGNTMTAGGYINDFNEAVKDTFSVDPKWRKETTPILEEVLAKRGAAMTVEQMLLFQFGKDIGIKAFQYVQIKKQQNEIINILKDIKEQYGSSQGGYSAPPPPKKDKKSEDDVTTQPYAYAPSTPPPTEDYPPINEERYNFETNETVMASTVQQMKVPSSGKARAMAQRQKEKKWKQDSDNASTSSYDAAMKERKTGVRGRKKKTVADYVRNVDKEDIVDALILSETKNEDTKK